MALLCWREKRPFGGSRSKRVTRLTDSRGAISKSSYNNNFALLMQPAMQEMHGLLVYRAEGR